MSAARTRRLPGGYSARRLTITLSDEAWAALADMSEGHRSVFLGQEAAERFFLSRLLDTALSARVERPLADVVAFPSPTLPN